MEFKEKYVLENGWVAYLDTSDKTFLHIFPIENTLFRKEKLVTIPIETFVGIKNGDRNIKSLFKKYKLHNDIIEWQQPVKRNVKRENSETKFYGKGYISTEENSKLYLYYQLSRQGGGERKIPVSKAVYIDSRSGDYSLPELFKKYNLYKFDKSKYDV